MTESKFILKPWLMMERGEGDTESILVDTHSGRMLLCNETALVLLKCLKHGATEIQLVGELVSNFSVSEDEARNDLNNFFQHLGAMRLIDEAT